MSIQSTPVIPTPVSQHWRGNPLPGIIADGYRQEALRRVFPSLLSLDSAVSVFIVQPRLFKKAPQIHALNQRGSPFRALRSGFPLTGGRMLFCLWGGFVPGQRLAKRRDNDTVAAAVQLHNSCCFMLPYARRKMSKPKKARNKRKTNSTASDFLQFYLKSVAAPTCLR